MPKTQTRVLSIPDTMLVTLTALSIGGCAAPDRSGAAKLASAGSAAAGALATEVDGRIAEVRSVKLSNDFNYAYSILATCPNITQAGGSDPNCDVLALAKDRRTAAVNVEIEKLADVMVLRRRALNALSQAYVAFESEAKYDARGDLEAALGPALSSANNLASAVGLAPISGVVLKGAELAGGLFADQAQRTRLRAGSRSLGAITGQVRKGLEGEQVLHQQIETLLGTLDRDTRTNLLRAGLIDPEPALKAVVGTSGAPAVAEAKLSSAVKAQPPLGGAALVAAISAEPTRPDALEAGVTALRAVEVQHKAFEAGAPVSIESITDAVERVTAVIEAEEE